MANIEKRTTKGGSTHYRVRVRLKGYPTQTASFERVTDARNWAQSVESAIREGRHFKTTEAKKHTLSDLVDRYVASVLPTKRDRINPARQLAWWKDEIGYCLLADVTPALIAEKRDKLLSGATTRGETRSPSTVVRYLAALSHAFSLAVKEWGWSDINPLERVTKPKEPRGRIRFLDEHERTLLLEACRVSDCPVLYPIVVLALSTGMRRSEIMNLYWREPPTPPADTAWGVVHLDQKKIILHQTKNGEIRNVPLVGHAMDALRTLGKVRRIDNPLLFPGTIPGEPLTVEKHWQKALRAAAIDNFRFHDLRHCTASYLAMNGASLPEIAEVLGHKTLQMVKRYAHLSDSHTSGVVERMNAKIFQA